ncbi:tyrosine-type recombinase/integrase [Neoroseomonas alba]|nr:site-specific integrase [Neoroseomonas alba]
MIALFGRSSRPARVRTFSRSRAAASTTLKTLDFLERRRCGAGARMAAMGRTWRALSVSNQPFAANRYSRENAGISSVSAAHSVRTGPPWTGRNRLRCGDGRRDGKEMALHDRALPGLPPGRHFDDRGTGLFFFVRPDGSRSWGQRLRILGRQRDLGLGPYPEIRLSAAREAAKVNKEAARDGRDPLAEKRARREAEAPRSMADALAAWIEAHSPAWRSAKTKPMVEASMKLHARRLLRIPAKDVTIEDVRAVLAPIWNTKPVAAKKLRGWLDNVLEFAIAAGWRSGENPATPRRLKPLLSRPGAARVVRNHPALPLARMHDFMALLRDRDGAAARALEFAILTAARSGEVRGATWGEIDLDRRLWVIPAARMKVAKEHRVPLSAPALAILIDQLPGDGSKPDPAALVFPGQRQGRPLSDMTLLKILRDLDAGDRKGGGPGWRDEQGHVAVPHGFRSAFRDWCALTGKDHVAAELALAHSVGSAVERAYRRADLVEQRAVLMRDWAAFIDAPPAQVVPLIRARDAS